jgi:glycosyl transferase family 25
MENLHGIVYINLDKRVDRREQIELELKEYGLKAERFSAILHTHGLVGCMKSHLAVLKMAKTRGWENVLVLEDDFEFLVSKEKFESLLSEFFALQIPYDVAMLSYNLKKSQPFHGLLLKVVDAQTASGYIVHKRFYDKLIQLYEKTLPKLEQTELWDTFANDQIWKTLQPKSAWYAFKTRIGKQRESFSDNTGKMENYGC